MRRAAALLALCSLGACTSSGTFFNRGARQASQEPATRNSAIEDASIDTGGLAVYLQTMDRLIAGDSLTKAEVFNELEDSAEFAPTTRNRLLYALALSIPGHPGTDPAAGAERLRNLIAAGDTLRPEERMLAEIILQAANRLDVLETATEGSEQRLATRLAERETELNTAHEAELARALADNEELKRQLEDANAMLDAITNIERSISEREEP
jgi:hypothetical protein